MSCLADALTLVAKRDWLRAELRAKLLVKHPETETDQALDWLDKHHVLKDERVVERAAQLNTGRKAMSREAWMEKLRQRGANDGLLVLAAETLPSDLDQATALLRRKSWKNVAQAARHLSAKGFEAETIESALEANFDEDFRSQ